MGIDGSGKTTHAKLLYKNLKKAGYKVKVIYAGNTGVALGRKYSFYLSLPLDIFIRRIMKMKKQDFYERYPKLMKLEEFLLFLNYILLVLPKIFICRILFEVTIADRYIYDYILYHILSCIEFSRTHSYTLSRTLLMITPKPEVLFILDLDEEIAYSRKGEKSLSYLRLLRKGYLKLANQYDAIVVSSDDSIITTFMKLWYVVSSKLRRF
ncbi:MAG: hypothetical protein QXJ97_07395 [Desulfurococcaceae archaeon]